MEKTVVVLFTHRRDNINHRLKIGEEYVSVENKAKFLGLVFDSKLTWNHHVSYVVDKCKKRQNFLRAVSGNKWGASKKILLLGYTLCPRKNCTHRQCTVELSSPNAS